MSHLNSVQSSSSNTQHRGSMFSTPVCQASSTTLHAAQSTVVPGCARRRKRRSQGHENNCVPSDQFRPEGCDTDRQNHTNAFRIQSKLPQECFVRRVTLIPMTVSNHAEAPPVPRVRGPGRTIPLRPWGDGGKTPFNPSRPRHPKACQLDRFARIEFKGLDRSLRCSQLRHPGAHF